MPAPTISSHVGHLPCSFFFVCSRALAPFPLPVCLYVRVPVKRSPAGPSVPGVKIERAMFSNGHLLAASDRANANQHAQCTPHTQEGHGVMRGLKAELLVQRVLLFLALLLLSSSSSASASSSSASRGGAGRSYYRTEVVSSFVRPRPSNLSPRKGACTVRRRALTTSDDGEWFGGLFGCGPGAFPVACVCASEVRRREEADGRRT